MAISKQRVDSILASKPRLCENETVEVWNIDSESISGVYATAGAILLDYDSEPYSNLVTQQIDTGSGLEFNGILYVHL
jgi:hypothetical protein